MASHPPSSKPIDRQTTTPFLLRLFYRNNSFHHLEDFTPTSVPQSHFQIYTWPDLSLRELTLLLTSTLSSLAATGKPNLPAVAPGTRVAYRLVYPDTRAASFASGVPGRFIARDLGSVVVGDEGEDSGPAVAGYEADKTLQDARFIIGDYVSCCVLPPLANGDVAPPPVSAGPGVLAPAGNGFGGRGGRGRGRRFDDGGGYGRLSDANGGGFEDDRGYGRGGYGGRGGRRGGDRYGGGYGRLDDVNGFGGGGRGGGSSLPPGEWRRGERVPEGFGGSGYRGGRGRGRPY
ncbi:hypothetical protein FH972_025461 [Carpinus fangiana]|uniref:Histone deacetylase complex subunit SAP18 n=1 Tax=Carpinus fangiana TaxID=176857 RepID=A0A5N6L129_9ROSI|nr:hypothetical protein FH972_025461 [Carpinus fangiana]